MRIAIIGGGIGGLTAALALRQFGFEPRVFEQAPQLLDVGAAILIWPNAMRVLDRLGLSDPIRMHGAVLKKAQWLRHDGRLLNSFSLPETDVPAVALHRADLQHALQHALPPDSLHLNCTFQSYEQHPDKIVAHFRDAGAFECDVLIGADGLHSRVRAQLLQDGPPTEYSYAAWRGVLPTTPKSAALATATEIYGRGRRFGIGPLGHGRVGWWASANKSLIPRVEQNRGARASDAHAPPGDDHQSIREELLRLFDGWCDPVIELIRDTPLNALVKNAVCDRRPVRKWSEDGVILLGDAIHPVTPNLGQGGCLAIEDAAMLTRCFERCASPEHVPTESPVPPRTAAMRRFAALRRPRTAALARYSRLYGVVGQLEGQFAVGLRDRILSLVPNVLTQRFLRGVFDYDAYEVGS